MPGMDKKIYYYLEKIKKIQNNVFVPPVSCEIDPSNACNAKCSWCMFAEYRKHSTNHLKWDHYLKLVYELKHLGTKSITFTGGGEPLMNPKFNDMVDVAKNLGFELGLVTNGIQLHELKRPEYFKFIRVSLDSSNQEMYEKVKGVDFFPRVIENIKDAVRRNGTVGLSYVVGPDNRNGIEEAQTLADSLKVAYIQFKPMYINGGIYEDFRMPDEEPNTIETKRYKAGERLPCHIAHLVGVVTADGGVYYCCQGRGKTNFYIGSIAHESFEAIWRRRLLHRNYHIKQCPPCRYMNYAKGIKDLLEEGDLFFEHKNFL